MERDKLKEQLDDVNKDAAALGRMLERSAAETKILDVVTAIQLLADGAVVEYFEKGKEETRATVVIDESALDDAKKHALRSYMGAVPNWHLDDRPRKDETWRARRH